MAGSTKQTSRHINWSLKLCFAVLLLVSSLHATAQSQSDVRIEAQVYYAGDEIRVHVSVPRGQTIERADAVIGGVSIPLSPEPVPLRQTYWLVLDSGESMLNAYVTIITALERFLQGNSDVRVGIIIYDTSLDILQPTNQISDIETFLSTYNPTAGAISCLNNALNQVERLINLDDSGDAARVLLIAGTVSRQGNCEEAGTTVPKVPIDAIILSDTIDDLYLDWTDRSGGSVRQANVRTIGARLNEIKILWSQPIYAVTASVPSLDGLTGNLSMTLSSGITVSLPLNLTAITQEVAEVATPTQSSGLSGVPTSTLPPTNTLPPTETPTETLMATISAAESTPRTEPIQVQETAAATEFAIIAETEIEPTQAAQVENSPAPVETQEQGVAIADAGSNPDEPDEASSNNPPEQSAESAALVDEPADESGFGIASLLGIAGAITAVVIGAIWFAFRPKPVRYAPVAAASSANNFYESTMVVMDESHSFSVTGTEIMPEEVVHPDAMAFRHFSAADELMITAIVTDEEFMSMQHQSRGSVFAWLSIEGKPEQRYELLSTGLLIGRKPACDIVISDDDKVSGTHLQIEVRNNSAVWLKNISRSNPIAVSGVPVQPGQVLQLTPQEIIQLSPKTRVIYVQNSDNVVAINGSNTGADNNLDEGLTQL